jgi:glycosyltransferase involved in cell wall biosynthesis
VPKKKVVRLIARLNIGGPAIHTVLLSRDLDPERFETVLIAGVEASGEGSMRDWALEQGVNPILIPELGREIRPFSDFKVLVTLYRFFRREKPDIVHTHTAKAGFVGRLAARLAGVPVVVHTFHGHVFHSYFGPFKTRSFIFLERLLAHLTDRIVTISCRQGYEIERYGIASPDKIVIILLGFDLGPFLNCDALHGRLRNELALAEEVKLVGIVARLTQIKNHDLFLEAAALVYRRCHSVNFLIVGDGELRVALERQTNDLGLNQVVHFLGWREDLSHIYADLDLVVLTSHNEGTPVTLIEAQASARPVVATAVGGVPDIVIDGQTGLLVPPDDASALAEAMLAVLRTDSASMGQAGRQLVAEKFAIARLVHDIESLYDDLIDDTD